MSDLQTLSVLISRASLAAKLGTSYNGDRDLYQALGYPTEMTFWDFYARYRRQDIAKAIIDRPVQAIWKDGFELLESDDDQETELEKAFSDLSKQLALISKFSRLDKLAGLGQYGVLLIGFDDVRQPEDFTKPVSAGKRTILYVKPLSEESAQINEWESDPQDERYGLPKTYNITLWNPGQQSSAMVVTHHSRVLHVVDGLLESEVEGIPRLEAIFNRLMDIEKIVGGSGEMFWRGARPGYHGKVDPEFSMTQETKDDLKDQIDEYEHNLRRILVNQGIDLQSLQQQLADPSTYVDVQIQMISAVTGIPKRILTGSERGELASSQDKDSWLSWIANRRTEFAEANIIRPFIDKCMLYGVLPEAKDDYTVKWSELFAETEQEKATIGQIRASALGSYASSPTAPSIVPPEAFFEYFLGFDSEQIEVITEMAEAGIAEEEKAMSKLGLSPEQLDQVQNPNKYINGKKIIPGTEPTTHGGAGSGNFGHTGRPGSVGGSGSGWVGIVSTSKKDIASAVAQIQKVVPSFTTINVNKAADQKRAVEIINTVGSELTRLSNDHPMLNKLFNSSFFNITRLGIHPESVMGNADGSFATTSVGGILKLSTSSKSVGDHTTSEPFAVGGFTIGSGHLASIFRHELGHALYKVPEVKDSWSSFLDSRLPSGSYDKQTGDFKTIIAKDWITQTLSKYGATNANEAHSEAFAAYTARQHSDKLYAPILHHFNTVIGK